MKKNIRLLALLFTTMALISGSVFAQNLVAPDGSFAKKRTINNKKFHAMYTEVVVDKTVDEVWNEVAGNFMGIGEIMHGINFTRCLSGDTTEGLGARRFCSLNANGKTVELKEKIIEFKVGEDYREFTYDVYEAKGFPAKSFNSWIVRKGEDGKTYLGSLFAIRANLAFLTGTMVKKLSKSGFENGVLAYKHYLETGKKKVDPERFAELYPGACQIK